MKDIAFVHAVEAGPLEAQSILLCKSIRLLEGIFGDSTIFAVTPRDGPPLSSKTLEMYEDLRVVYLRRNVNVSWKDYPFVNTTYAAATVEEEFGDKFEYMILTDTDTFFMSDPYSLCFDPESYLVALKPCDSLAPEIAVSFGSKLPSFWRKVYQICEVEEGDLWPVTTTVDSVRIYAYFNNGIVSVDPRTRIFTQAISYLEAAAKELFFLKLKKGSIERFYLDQAFLSAVITKLGEENVLLLEKEYNMPYLQFRSLEKRFRGTIKHVHYHDAFYFRSSVKAFRGVQRVFPLLEENLPLPFPLAAILFLKTKRLIPQEFRNLLRGTPLMSVINFIGKLVRIEF